MILPRCRHQRGRGRLERAIARRNAKRARASWKGGSKQTAVAGYRDLKKTEFEGYHNTRSKAAKFLGS